MRQTRRIYSNFIQFVTAQKQYIDDMNYTTTFTNCLLSAHLIGGALWLVFLFALCFIGVHIVRIAQAKKKKPPKPKEEPKADIQPPTPQEPIYYIVEKKQRRAKAKYGEPKEIHFK